MDRLTWWSELSPTKKLQTGMWLVIATLSSVVVWEERDKRAIREELTAKIDSLTTSKDKRIEFLTEALRLSEINCEKDKTRAVQELLEEQKRKVIRQEELISLQRELYNSTNTNVNKVQQRLDRAQKAINRVQ